jgi:hypothetical protein
VKFSSPQKLRFQPPSPPLNADFKFFFESLQVKITLEKLLYIYIVLQSHEKIIYIHLHCFIKWV